MSSSLEVSVDGSTITIDMSQSLSENEVDKTTKKIAKRFKKKNCVEITEAQDEASVKALKLILVELKDYPKVTTLKIEQSVIDQECFEKISRLENLNHLSFLGSSFETCNDYKSLKKLKKLTEIDLSCTDILEDDFDNLYRKEIQETKFIRFLKAIQPLTHLNKLNLSSNSLIPQMKQTNGKKSKKVTTYNENYNKWAKDIVDKSVGHLVDCFRGSDLNLSDCGLGPTFLGFYQTHIEKAKRKPDVVDLTDNAFDSEEVADFIWDCETLPSKILFDYPDDIKIALASLILDQKNVKIEKIE